MKFCSLSYGRSGCVELLSSPYFRLSASSISRSILVTRSIPPSTKDISVPPGLHTHDVATARAVKYARYNFLTEVNWTEILYPSPNDNSGRCRTTKHGLHEHEFLSVDIVIYKKDRRSSQVSQPKCSFYSLRFNCYSWSVWIMCTRVIYVQYPGLPLSRRKQIPDFSRRNCKKICRTFINPNSLWTLLLLLLSCIKNELQYDKVQVSYMTIWKRVHAHHSSCTVHTTVWLPAICWDAPWFFRDYGAL